MIAMTGTSDRPCWLAEACKICRLLLLLLRHAVFDHHMQVARPVLMHWTQMSYSPRCVLLCTVSACI